MEMLGTEQNKMRQGCVRNRVCFQKGVTLPKYILPARIFHVLHICSAHNLQLEISKSPALNRFLLVFFVLLFCRVLTCLYFGFSVSTKCAPAGRKPITDIFICLFLCFINRIHSASHTEWQNKRTT